MTSKEIIKKEEIKHEDDSSKPKSFVSSTPGGPKLTDEQKKEEQMKQRARNFSQQAIKQIVEMDMVTLKKVVNTGACNLPLKYAKDIPNAFIRYMYEKELLQVNQKGKTADQRAQLRKESKHLYDFNEFSWLFKKLMAEEFEDSWIDSHDLPDLPLIENPDLLTRCVHVFNFLKSYQHVIGIRKLPGILDFMNSLEHGKDGFIYVTCRLLKSISVFIHKNRKTIKYFRMGIVPANMYDAKSIRLVHFLARKILNLAYQLKDESESDEGASDSEQSEKSNSEVESGDGGNEQRPKAINEEMEVDGESGLEMTIDEKEVCELFCEKNLYELSPMEQVRVFELLLERAELSGPILNAINNSDSDTKTLKAELAHKQKELTEVKNQLKEMPPMIPKEQQSGRRSGAAEAEKKNRERQAVEDEKQELEDQIPELQKALEEIQAGSRLRASPIGYDRFHRGYWIFPLTPGLIVQQGALTTETPDENAPLALPPMETPEHTMSTNELLMFLHTLLNGGYPSPKAPIKWFHVNSKELLDELLKSLCSDGVRESHLKKAIKHCQADIEESFSSSA